jgi:hypothetical protein
MSSSKNSYNIVSDYPKYHAYILIFFAVVINMILCIAFFIQSDSNEKKLDTQHKHFNWNLMVDGFSQNKNLLPKDSPGYRFVNDIYAFEKSEKATNPFSPKTLEEINISSSAYYGIDSQLGCAFRDVPSTVEGTNSAGSHYTCTDGGYLSPDFLNMYHGLKDQDAKPSLYYKKSVKQDLSLHLFLWDIPWWQFFGGLWLFSWILMLFPYFIMTPGGWTNEVKIWTTKETNSFLGFLLFPPAYIVIRLIDYFRNKKDKIQIKEREKELAAKIANHPLRAELQTAETKLQTLSDLAITYPNDKEIQKALKDCRSFVEELRTFPEKLSAKSAKYMAIGISKELQGLKDVATTRLESVDEVEKLS